MKKTIRNSFIFYRSFYESIKLLPREKRLEIYEAIAEFSLNEKKIELKNIQKSIFILIKPQLEANRKRFNNGCCRKKSKPEANDKQTTSKTEANLNLNLNLNDNVNDNIKEKRTKKKKYSKEMIETWNSICANLPEATLHVNLRNNKLNFLIGSKKVRDREGDPLIESLEDWKAFCKIIHKSDFLCGRDKRAWGKCTIDWCLKPANMIKIYEGNYNNEIGKL